MIRLDKFLSEYSLLSRSDGVKKIKAGAVSVNGEIIIKNDFKIDEKADMVLLDGVSVIYEKYVYFMLNKPSGIITASKDKLSKTVMDLFKNEPYKDLYPVGRLDKDTVGLLIITNDGELGHRLLSPKKNVKKVYNAKIAHKLSKEDIKMLESGVSIGEGEVTKPAGVEVISDCEILLTITEGRFHEVKRMLQAVDNEVLSLKRLSMGSLKLDLNLKEGEYRRLTGDEIDSLLRLTGMVNDAS